MSWVERSPKLNAIMNSLNADLHLTLRHQHRCGVEDPEAANQMEEKATADILNDVSYNLSEIEPPRLSSLLLKTVSDICKFCSC